MEFISEALKQIPHLAVLAGLVVLFIKSKRESEDHFISTLSKMDEGWRQELKVRDEALVTLGDNCHEFQRMLADRNDSMFTKIVERNEDLAGKVIDVLNRNSDMLGRAIHVIERLETRLDGTRKKISGDAG